MRVETEKVEVRVYYFSKDEAAVLCQMGFWDLLNERLKHNERVELE